MALGRPLSPLSLYPSERQQLLDWTRRPKTAQALALRARIVLHHPQFTVRPQAKNRSVR